MKLPHYIINSWIRQVHAFMVRVSVQRWASTLLFTELYESCTEFTQGLLIFQTTPLFRLSGDLLNNDLQNIPMDAEGHALCSLEGICISIKKELIYTICRWAYCSAERAESASYWCGLAHAPKSENHAASAFRMRLHLPSVKDFLPHAVMWLFCCCHQLTCYKHIILGLSKLSNYEKFIYLLNSHGK